MPDIVLKPRTKLKPKIERPKPLPNSISESVLHGEKAEAAPIGVAGGKPTTAV